jgi:hypothetical protein
MSTTDDTTPVARPASTGEPTTLTRIRWRCAAIMAALQTAALLLLGLPFILAGELFDALFLGDVDRAR